MEYNILVKKADSLYESKDYKNSALAYNEAFKTMGNKGLTNDRYNAARAWTMSDKPDKAFDCLDRIANIIGFSDFDRITKEEAFNSLHKDKRWQTLLDKIKQNKLPTGWFRAGSKPTSYKMFLDTSSGQEGDKTLSIKSVEKNIDGFGTLMQNFSPEKYIGKRIRMTGYMKSKDVESWAGFWLRIDQLGSRLPLSFDNMHDRPVDGTTNWKKYEIILDVHSTASNIAFGALLTGAGQIWFEKLNFEIVDYSIPTTGKKNSDPNLDFDK
ncbi:MAG: hypothetical protein ACHQK8_02690 [Bacteroidia bacterium]